MACSSGCTGNRGDGEEEEMSAYRKDALSVVTFKLVYDKKNLEQNKCLEFKPLMAHQIFGDNESIFGYRSLSINLYYLHNSARCYVDLEASGEIKHALNEPDNVMNALNENLPENYTTDRNEFLKMVENEKHDVIYGTVLTEFRDIGKKQLVPNKEEFATYKITLCDTTDANFQQFHARYETYITWFIDGANFIDLSDERWLIFYAFEETIHPETEQCYITPVGYCTVYKFLAYPNKIRARISQFFVLPSHQRRGVGTRLYQTVFKSIHENPEVVDITVEEPTIKFQRIRDVDDCSRIHTILKDSGISLSRNNMQRIYEVMKNYKICKKQCQRLYDILGAYEASHNEDSYRSYLANLKERLRAEIERQTRGSKKKRSNMGENVNIVPADWNAVVEANFKKYTEDIEQSMRNFKNKLENSH